METFRSPGAEFGVHPFWFWNGEMEDDEIVRQIEAMAASRVGGFFICPRQGLQVPYLSDVWFAKVRLAVETAARLDLEVWLYDEYPYPSGMAGGEVILKHPEAKQYTLQHRCVKVAAGESCDLQLPWARLLQTRAVPIDTESGKRDWSRAVDVSRYVGNYQVEPVFQKVGLTAYNRKRFFTYDTVKRLIWTAPGQTSGSSETWEVHCFLEEEIEDFKYYGTFVDPCNREAMATFIELTHQRYAKELGEYFGTTIKGVFTDEIGLLGDLPWSTHLATAFAERNGYELLDYLPALFDAEVDQAAQVRYDYFQVVHELLRDSYHKQVYDWCEQNGLRYAAEVPSVRMTTQLYSHVPGGDSGHEKLGRSLQWMLDRYGYSLRYNPKMISSLANQLSRDRVLIECFHSVGWSMTLQDARWMIDRLAALGANFFNFHAFFYTVDGLAKHDAPPSQFMQNPYWAHFHLLGDYVRRISYAMSRGRADRPIAVLDPTTTFWTHLGNPFHEFGYGGKDEVEQAVLERLKSEWFEVCKILTLSGRDFDHLDPELLAVAEIRGGEISIGDALYKAVLLPPLTNLEETAWRKLLEFRANGGLIIAVGELPSESLKPADPVPEEMRRELTPIAPAELVTALDVSLPRTVSLEMDGRTNSLLMHRRLLDDGSSLIFLTHQEDENLKSELCIANVDEAWFERLDLETGESSPLEAVRNPNGSWKVRLELAPYESALIYVGNGSRCGLQGHEEVSTWTWSIESAGEWSISPDRPNSVRFDTFDLSIQADDGSFIPVGRVEAKTFIDQCEDITGYGSVALPLQFRQIFGTPIRIGLAYPLRCRYEVSFYVNHLPQECIMIRDANAISGCHRIWINDQLLLSDKFVPRFVYDHRNIACSVRDVLVPGRNTIIVEVEIGRDWDGLVDAIYLCGDFGVYAGAEGVRLAKPAKYAPLRGGVWEGYPYYAGAMTFHRSCSLDRLPDRSNRFELCFKGWDDTIHDVVEVRVNGVSLGVRPWTPYVWYGPVSLLNEGENEVEVIITNTLIGLLEGKFFDYTTHSLQPVIQ